MAASDDKENFKRQRQKRAPGRDGFCPSGRPLNYEGSRNWERRIITRTVCGGAIGVLAGLGVGLYKKQNPFTWLTSMGANCTIATCCFCGFQELTRELRAADPDDWANCFLGGLASGALLGRIHGLCHLSLSHRVYSKGSAPPLSLSLALSAGGSLTSGSLPDAETSDMNTKQLNPCNCQHIRCGPARALPTAVLFASVGTGINFGALLLKEYRLQRLLAAEVSDDERGAALPAMKESKLSGWFDFELPEWSPIRKLDEEEAKRRYLERENQRRRTLQSFQTGNFPVKDH